MSSNGRPPANGHTPKEPTGNSPPAPNMALVPASPPPYPAPVNTSIVSHSSGQGLARSQGPGTPQQQNGSSGTIFMAKGEKLARAEVTGVSVQSATAEVDGVKVTAVTATGIQIEAQTHEQFRMVATADGVVAQKITQRQYYVREVMLTNLYVEASAPGAITQDEDEVKATCSEKCTDLCCQSTTCNFSNPFKRNSKKAIQGREIMTATLRRGRAKGWNMYSSAVFPLFRPAIRDFWVVAELLLVFVGLGLSIATLTLDQNRIFNILHLALAILSALLAVVDGILTLKECRSCKICCSKRNDGTYDFDDDIYGEKPKALAYDNEDKGCCKCCFSCCKNTCDVVRVILTEMLVYPILICDMFEVITGRGYEATSHGDRLGFALFLLSCISYVLYVYVARLLILAGMIKSVQEIRKPSEKELASSPEGNYDPTITRSALIYQVYFFIHVSLQMLAQTLMFVAIGGKIRYDNRHFYSRFNDDDTIHVSGTLWYMIVTGYFLPLMGFLTFFLVTYFWSQEFPIGLCIDMISIWKMGGPDDIMFLDEKNKKKKSMMLDLINQFVKINQLKTEFTNLRKVHCSDKFAYPFKAPVLVVVSISYAAFQLAFVVCAAVAVNEMGLLVTQILNGGGWVFYYIVAVVIGVIANLYVFLVAALWVLIIASILATIALMIACLCALFLLAGCASNSNNNNR